MIPSGTLPALMSAHDRAFDGVTSDCVDHVGVDGGLPAATDASAYARTNVRSEWIKLRSVRSTHWTLLATVRLGALVGVSEMSREQPRPG